MMKSNPLHLAALGRAAFCVLIAAAAIAQEPGPVAARGPAQTGATQRLAAIDRELVEIESLLDSAHFRTALGLAEATRQWLHGARPGPALSRRSARLEVLMATAQIAMGHATAARSALARAFAADPLLRLDPAQTSPKLLALVPRWRREATP